MKFVNKPIDSDTILVGFPIDQGTENKGCKETPFEIRKNFENFYFPEDSKLKNVFDASDIVEEEKFEKTIKKIKLKLNNLLKYKKKIVSIGGNHSISVPIVKAFNENYKNLGIIFIDAHPDCQKDYFPFGDVVTKIIEENIPIVLIGLRNWSKDEYNFLIEKEIPFIQAKDFSIKKAINLIDEYLYKKNIYISLDIDAIDPSFAPGTGCIEPCGLMSRDVLELIKKIDNVVGFDLVEINPKKDINNITLNLGAKIIFEVINN